MMKESDDLSKLTQTIGEIIEEGVKKTESMPSPCIFRVPEVLRKVKESAYTPQLVSIGPLHSNKEHIKSPMEDIKKHYTKVLFKQVKTANKTTDIMSLLKNCVEKMKLSLDRARDCYAEKVEVDALEDVEKMKASLVRQSRGMQIVCRESRCPGCNHVFTDFECLVILFLHSIYKF
ncbi:hypothetical protein ACSBR1_003304 [Camellia fascicularis]